MSAINLGVALLVAATVAALGAGRARADAPAPGHTLRVVSYNTWLFPIAAADVATRRDRMGPALAALEPDVLCLQELWDKGGLAALRGALRRRLPHGQVGGGGLAIASRWPIVDARFDAFPSHTTLSMFERLSKKGFLTVVVATPVGPLRVVTSHLAFERGRDRDAHRLQLDTLVAALAADRDVPTIICGDLNFRAVEAGAPSHDFAALRAIGFEDAAGTAPDASGRWTPREATRLGWPRTPAHRRANDPDYILYRGGARVALEPHDYRQALDTRETALSDHNALVVDFTAPSARARAR